MLLRFLSDSVNGFPVPPTLVVLTSLQGHHVSFEFDRLYIVASDKDKPLIVAASSATAAITGHLFHLDRAG
ncbi:MAG: hypothetical protein HYU53_04915 [Acidobacteria bacterium]|nr:hypothetical protein [Acidobacteriota bacterium]